jgi:hypothetical protein
LVGIFAEVSEDGRFDQCPLVTLFVSCDRPAARWLLAGPEGRKPFNPPDPRAAQPAPRGDVFRGRHTTIIQIRDWLTANEPPEPPFGSSPASRAGKSRVSARAVLEREADRSDPGWGSPRPPVVLAFVDFGCESACAACATQDH